MPAFVETLESPRDQAAAAGRERRRMFEAQPMIDFLDTEKIYGLVRASADAAMKGASW